MEDKAYDIPHYYEIALWHNANKKRMIDFFEACAKKYSKTRVRSIVELACGNSPILIDICKRGYQFTALDINQKMLDYSKEKARKAGYEIDTVKADMLDYRLKKKADLCFVMFNSVYRKTNQDFVKHLKQVSGSLNKGGLYILHMVVDGNLQTVNTKSIFTWKVTKGKISIDAKFERKIIDYPEQLREEKLILHVNDHGKKTRLVEKSVDKIIFPQEFKLLIEKTDFEFVEWFDGFDINKRFDNSKNIGYVICVIRKK